MSGVEEKKKMGKEEEGGGGGGGGGGAADAQRAAVAAERMGEGRAEGGTGGAAAGARAGAGAGAGTEHDDGSFSRRSNGWADGRAVSFVYRNENRGAEKGEKTEAQGGKGEKGEEKRKGREEEKRRSREEEEGEEGVEEEEEGQEHGAGSDTLAKHEGAAQEPGLYWTPLAASNGHGGDKGEDEEKEENHGSAAAHATVGTRRDITDEDTEAKEQAEARQAGKILSKDIVCVIPWRRDEGVEEKNTGNAAASIGSGKCPRGQRQYRILIVEWREAVSEKQQQQQQQGEEEEEGRKEGKEKKEENQEPQRSSNRPGSGTASFRLRTVSAADLPAAFLRDFLVAELPPTHLAISPSPSPFPPSPRPECNIHVLVSTASGTAGSGKAAAFCEHVVRPTFAAVGVPAHAYAVHETRSARTIPDFARTVLRPRARRGVAQTVLLLSGDGGVHDIVNGLLSPNADDSDDSCDNDDDYKNAGSGNNVYDKDGSGGGSSSGEQPLLPSYQPPTLGILALGTGNALAHSLRLVTPASAASLGLRSFLRGAARPLPLFHARFSPGARLVAPLPPPPPPPPPNGGDCGAGAGVGVGDGVGVLHGAVVLSYGLHASLVAESDSPAYRKYGAQRFQLAANNLLFPPDGAPPHAYLASVSFLRACRRRRRRWTGGRRPHHAGPSPSAHDQRHDDRDRDDHPHDDKDGGAPDLVAQAEDEDARPIAAEDVKSNDHNSDDTRSRTGGARWTTIPRQEHAYVLTSLVSNLEANFVISPLSSLSSSSSSASPSPSSPSSSSLSISAASSSHLPQSPPPPPAHNSGTHIENNSNNNNNATAAEEEENDDDDDDDDDDDEDVERKSSGNSSSSSSSSSSSATNPFLVHFGPAAGADVMRIMGLAYAGGKHVHDRAVGYEEVQAVRIALPPTSFPSSSSSSSSSSFPTSSPTPSSSSSSSSSFSSAPISAASAAPSLDRRGRRRGRRRSLGTRTAAAAGTGGDAAAAMAAAAAGEEETEEEMEEGVEKGKGEGKEEKKKKKKTKKDGTAEDKEAEEAGEDTEARWRKICVDGTIVQLEPGGWVELRRGVLPRCWRQLLCRRRRRRRPPPPPHYHHRRHDHNHQRRRQKCDGGTDGNEDVAAGAGVAAAGANGDDDDGYGFAQGMEEDEEKEEEVAGARTVVNVIC